MLKASRSVEYGLIAIKWMSKKSPSEVTSAREISRRFGAPFETLARTLQILQREGILESVAGAQGGYRIRADLGRLSMDRFCRLIEGDVGFLACMRPSGCMLLEQCNIVSPMKVLHEKLQEFLANVSVLELVGELPSSFRPSVGDERTK